MASPATTTTAVAFDKILNFRDVGAFVNATDNKTLLRTGLFYRSARLDSATPADQHKLIKQYGVNTVIDLRTPTEHIEARKEYATTGASTLDPKYPLHIQGLTYRHVNFNGSAYSSALIKQLSYWHAAKLAGLYVFGFRKEAISVLGTNVMAARGLAGLAEDSLEHCTAEVKAVFDVLADDSAYPVIVHCTQGKDRTGLITLLVLLTLGVPIDVIEKDYRKSEPELEPERAEKLVGIRSIGLPDTFADCPADWVTSVHGFITDTYGSAEEYLIKCGVTEEQITALKNKLSA
ncbi:Hypothetical protein R9X50_00399000 [Acrodontium crateriforme]|uniref:Tyrosine specific protein phosphatases domain-containing protein n=1 Tax=Acrodontium crateriforme TaxID=150365 RepID=A0AAQ3RAC7_9PEZI|nr:Hypothetical protein R9X50_00399000 [Acrodontium crateriforme]